MNDVVFVELPETATMLETGTPQAIALRKENVVESELKAIERYRGLTIAGVDDVQGIKLVSDARKYCKKLRTTAERICKEGREGAIKEQKLWLTVEKYVVGRVSVVEKELVMEEERIETLREAQKREAVRLAKVEDDRLQGICNEFAQLGVMKAKDEIRSMEPGTLEALLSEARREKAEKEAAVKREAEARDAEVKRLRDEKLADAVKQADCVIVPIQPSAFDIGATSDFLDRLAEEKVIRKNKTFVALVGMRVNNRTHAAAGLANFMEQTGFPVLTYLRNAQVYATAAELGVSLFDMRPSFVAQDLEQWAPILDWVIEATAD